MRLILIDNNDSFTYNIVNIFRKIESIDFDVVRSCLLSVNAFDEYDKVVISPGPGKPKDFPILKNVIKYCIEKRKALLGICLGHQAICEYFGGELVRLNEVVHGQKKLVMIDNSSPLYINLPYKIEVGLYHSWIINHDTLPSCLAVTGETIDKRLMSVKHMNYNIYGLQFHPESFMTKFGQQIIENFLKVK
jgi:anthranilate synthase/aminodeoxychorismate synthase-like glutamine amidotransferase